MNDDMELVKDYAARNSEEASTTLMTGPKTDLAKPTFIEYSRGSGRIIAACQCFHDQDGSGRGPLMPALIQYPSVREWFSPK